MTSQDIFRILDQLSPDELEQVQEYVNQLKQKLSETGTEKAGIIADLHGDYSNFLNALNIFDTHGISHILCAGDIVDRGSDADKIIEVIQERDILCIAGNHDRTVVANQERWRQHKNPQRMKQLGRIVSDETITFLENLPDIAEITIANKRILIAHGTPWSDVMTVFPDSRQSTFDRIYRDYADDYDIVILGHTHHPMNAVIGKLQILNPGSIYDVTIRDSNACAILSLPDCTFTLYDIKTANPIELAITDR